MVSYPDDYYHGFTLGKVEPLKTLVENDGCILLPHFQAIFDSRTVFEQPNLKKCDLQRWKEDYTRRGLYTKRVEEKLLGDEELFQIESKFESVRRKMFPEKASRFSCLWVAEGNENGRQTINDIIGTSAQIVKVKVAATTLTRADSRLIDEYKNYGASHPELIEMYWKGMPLDEKSPGWEFLVEGMIIMAVQAEKDELRKWYEERLVTQKLEVSP